MPSIDWTVAEQEHAGSCPDKINVGSRDVSTSALCDPSPPASACTGLQLVLVASVTAGPRALLDIFSF